MNTKNIILASALLVFAIIIGTLVAGYFSYNNREISLRQQAEAQRGKIEGVHDWIVQEWSYAVLLYRLPSSPS